MDALTISAASGLRARIESLQLLANNLANAGAGGYKSDQESYSLYLAPEAAADASGELPATLPVIERSWTDFSQGLLHATGHPFDLALSGKGFFVVNSPEGPLYTRNGSLRLSAAGSLITPEGYLVRTRNPLPLQLQPGKPVEIGPDGSVQQEAKTAGQLDIVDFQDPRVLLKVGKNYFKNPDPNVKPTIANAVEVHQGKLENSNVSTAEAAVRLVAVMRQFEMLQKAIGLAAEMNRKAVEEVARVGS